MTRDLRFTRALAPFGDHTSWCVLHFPAGSKRGQRWTVADWADIAEAAHRGGFAVEEIEWLPGDREAFDESVRRP